MTFVLLKTHGRLYSSYVPDPLSRSQHQFDSVAPKFVDADRRIVARRSEAEFNELLSLVKSSAALSGSSLHSMQDSRPNLDSCVAALSRANCLSVQTIVEANRAVTGHPGAALRVKPVWMDGRHPADSWYVAPPPEHLRAKLKELCAFAERQSLPISLRAYVCLLHLLQLHPFDDGNGRTARVVYASLMVRGLGTAGIALKALGKLWIYRGLHLHRTSLHLRDTGDWLPYLELCLAALNENCSVASP